MEVLSTQKVTVGSQKSTPVTTRRREYPQEYRQKGNTSNTGVVFPEGPRYNDRLQPPLLRVGYSPHGRGY